MSKRTGPVGVGVIGAGVISDQYMENLGMYADVRVIGITDVVAERAAIQADKYGVRAYTSLDELLGDPDVEIAINLTIPRAHVEVSMAALDAGKHVWSEKPISLDREGARRLLERAGEAGLLVGVAPDTVLGAGVQAGVRAVREGRIGRPISALTAVQNPGPDLWHPNPDFLFQRGAGPVLDVGPYYVTTLVHLFGSVVRVFASGGTTYETRSVHVGPRAGESFAVETPTNVGATLEFASGAFALSQYSFDSQLIRSGFVEITGSEATLRLPDPNTFDGSLTLSRVGDILLGQNQETVIEPGSVGQGRGLGVVDMARSIRAGGAPIVASGAVALHVIDVLLAIEESVSSGEPVVVESRVDEVPILPVGWDARAATL